MTWPKLHSQPEGQASAPGMSDNDNGIDSQPLPTLHAKTSPLEDPANSQGRRTGRYRRKHHLFFFLIN